MSKEAFRTPAVAGMFYPKEKVVLSGEIDIYMKNAEISDIKGKIIGLVAPHAGYIYSGQTAAYSYKQIENKEYKTVIIISPSHREYFEGISVFNGLGYSTPLGDIEIDTELKDRFLSMKNITMEGLLGHRSEHALEVQLPFLQKCLKNFKILPLVMGSQKDELCIQLGEILAEILEGRDDFLIVASSDLSHFYEAKHALILDNVIINDINNFNYNGILNDVSERKTEACGAGPIAAMLYASKKLGANKVKILKYSDSGDISGDKSEVVGYLSAVVWRDEEK